jgi:AmmeMemoRadiSam system protein B/AmmeMemoRadiSam system protein A
MRYKVFVRRIFSRMSMTQPERPVSGGPSLLTFLVPSMQIRNPGIVVPLQIFILLLFPSNTLLDAAVSREPAVAGRFYSGTEEALLKSVETLLQKVPESEGASKIAALVSPHAGYTYSGQTAAYGYNALKGETFQRVILLGPSHYAAFRGLSIPDVDSYRTPLGEVLLDQEACKNLKKHPLINSHPSAHRQEHSLEVQLPFLQTVLHDFKIVPVVIGHLEEEDYPVLAKVISSRADENTLIIASSDFTHYGPRYDYLPFEEEVPENLSRLDRGALHEILEVDRSGFLAYKNRTKDTICGFRPIALLLEVLSMKGVRQGKLLHYTTSGAVTGDFANSVSYASILFSREEQTMYLTEEEKKILLRLARTSLNAYVREQKNLSSAPEGIKLTELLKKPAGVFVTLEKKEELRGCIGYIEPIRPLYQAVMENAVSACSRDYRFMPVQEKELSQIEIEISVLTPRQEIAGPDGFIPGKHGIVFEKRGKRAVFLPQVATEQGWGREKTLQHLSRKAGLPPDAWKEGGQFWVFTAEVFGEGEEE